MDNKADTPVPRRRERRPRFMDWREEVAADKERRAEAGRRRDLAMLRRRRLNLP
ncbi:hypothetical protein SAMN05421505_11883 [Sinosporangium album]|uniref:Uncharacterized protein n=1 Tax=Sinosporangium album TaxID=504805 RepID=A0A1G8DKZ7_9ACTN|nr:hypothetical protein [Sinosporangium album]SDH58060.1 hypothetical protein SAMN05421505_11883 [Sinosporangium album]